MRLTNNIISKNYLKNLNSSLDELNGLNEQITAKRRYMKVSDDPATAIKAMKVRKNLSKIDLYTNSLSDAQGIIDQYESTIASINDVMQEAVANVLQGITGTSDSSSRAAVASALRGYQETILAAANTKYGDDYIFAGEYVENAPFSMDNSGNLMYNGQNVNTGTFGNEYRYIDIGMGISIDSSGNVAQKTAFNISNSGAQLLGSGVDADGVPQNIYNLLGAIAEKLENNDMTNIEAYSNSLSEKANDIRLKYVEVGEKSNFIEFFSDRLAAEKINASQRQNDLESIDYEEAIISYKEQELAYNACLQMGTKILQYSLMDYLK